MEEKTFNWKQNVKANGLRRFTEIARFEASADLDPSEIARLRRDQPMTYLALVAKIKKSGKFKELP